MTTSNPNGSSKNLGKNTADLKGSSTKINTAGLSMASKPINVVSLGKQAPSEIYVKKWVDYSSKYGLGYLLSNGASGVFFNDCTKVIMNPSKEYFEYIERRSSDRVDVVSCYTMKSYPEGAAKENNSVAAL